MSDDLLGRYRIEKPAFLHSARAAPWPQPRDRRNRDADRNALVDARRSIRECGPMPEVADLVEAMTDAGLEVAPPKRMMPGEDFFILVGQWPVG